jgi:hypothetical protein
MLPTMEVRWFSTGVIPSSVQEWFQRGEGDPEEQPRRVDYYLRPADGDSLGIKLREGRLEVKRLRGQLGIVRFHERVAGLVEQWCKWSFGLPSDGSALASPAVPSPSWIGVTKERRLYRYRLAGDRQVVAVSATDYVGPGCDLELTSVGVEGQAWWSLGFEARGDESSIQGILFLVAQQVLAANEPPNLTARDSYSYPRWLKLVEQRDAT